MDPAVSLMVAIGQEMVWEKILQGQGKVKCLTEVREKWNFKSSNLFFSLFFTTVL